jgi:hypothetical protein
VEEARRYKFSRIWKEVEMMNYFQSLSGNIIRAGSARFILLIFFTSFLNQTIFAESNPTPSNHSQKEMNPSSAAPPDSPLTKSSCKKTPMQCSSLCQAALSAESRAAKLEKSSKEARVKADKATRRAVFIEEKRSRKLQKINTSQNASSSGSVGSQSKSFWKLVAIVPRLFVSKEAADRSRQEEKDAAKYGANPSPNYPSNEAAELLMKSQMASKSAEESRKVAADAKMEADQARAYADSMRQSYKRCPSGMASK